MEDDTVSAIAPSQFSTSILATATVPEASASTKSGLASSSTEPAPAISTTGVANSDSRTVTTDTQTAYTSSSATSTRSTDASTSPTGSSNASAGLSTGAKAGIGVGAAIGGIAFAVAIVGFLLWRRKEAKKKKWPETVGGPKSELGPSEMSSEGPRMELDSGAQNAELPNEGRQVNEFPDSSNPYRSQLVENRIP